MNSSEAITKKYKKKNRFSLQAFCNIFICFLTIYKYILQITHN